VRTALRHGVARPSPTARASRSACNVDAAMKAHTDPFLRLRALLPAASVHARVAAAIFVLGFVFVLGVLRS